MNTAGLTTLGAKAKPLAETIARFCEAQGIAVEFRKTGKHPCAEITVNRQTRKVFFSGTPSDWRLKENVLRDIKQQARLIGWEPKEETMQHVTVKSLKDLPQITAESTAPSVTPSGVPRIPEQWLGKNLSGNKACPELRAAMDARNAWVAACIRAGWNGHRILDALRAAGWKIETEAALLYMQGKALGTIPSRAKTPEPAKPAMTPERVKYLEAKEREIAEEQKGKSPYEWRKRLGDLAAKRGLTELAEYAEKSGASALALAIEQAIIPVMEAHFAKQLAELKAKADKWDAISGLVREA